MLVAGPPAGWTVLCFSSVDWDSHRQRPQWVMATLANRGARVLWVDNIGIRLPGPADVRRVLQRLSRCIPTPGFRLARPASDVERHSPVVLPLQQFGSVRSLGRRTLLAALGAGLADAHPLVVWSYLPMPVIADVADVLRADLLVFDWCDDLSERVLTRSARQRRRIRSWEDRMIDRADLVVAASEELLRCRVLPNPRTHLVPHGVGHGTSGAALPREVQIAPRPRVGYVGCISAWTDLDLVAAIARARPDWSIILVGPVAVRIGALAPLPNVVFTGERHYGEIPAIISAFDAAIIPYRVAPATQLASPLKLHEYVAQGVPVVSVDIPAARQFGLGVEVASDALGFVRALERAIAGGRKPRPASVATWDDRVDEMISLAACSLTARRARTDA